ncbi:MAG: indolepyruvate ferredoxin oxidoreductase subunit alpha [Promethearchaeota archaeon]|jgi:NAD-dependent dihydropyrimidine dehydrogenase PreA subunit
MDIDIDVCNGCGQCIIVCPVQAIQMIDKNAVIDEEKCVECSVCYRDANCPVNAIRMKKLEWPREVRIPFSNVLTTHKVTGIGGRGTEEMKTNDVTNRYGFEEVGISIELGRPGVGTRLRNIELFTTRFSRIGVKYEQKSPVTSLIIDEEGHINEEVKEERVLSAIIEFKVPTDILPQVLEVISDVEREIDTVFSVGIVSRIGENNTDDIIDRITQLGFEVRPNAKINIGLGRP